MPSSCSASSRGSGGLATPWFELDAVRRGQGAPGRRRAPPAASPSGARAARASAAIFDLDDDGDLDIVTNEFNAAPMVLVSNLSERTQVQLPRRALTGTASNRNGLGAVVKVTAGGTTYTKVMDGNSGYLSHSVYPLYFGLGAADTVDRIEVAWPSGTKQTVERGDRDQHRRQHHRAGGTRSAS